MFNDKLKLMYKSPAESWDNALPVGNGAIGGMIFGGVFQEKIQLNEESVWYGKSIDRNNKAGAKYLKSVRELIKNNRLQEAEELMHYAFSGIPDSQRCYQSMGEILLSFPAEAQDFLNYERELDISKAVASVSYQLEDVRYKREIFCSYPDNVLVIKISSSSKESINLNCLLRRSDYLENPAAHKSSSMCLYGTSKYFDEIKSFSNDCLMLKSDNAVAFVMTLKACAVGGATEIIGEHLIIRNADEVTLYFSASTEFKEESYEVICKNTVEQAAYKGYAQLLSSHINDYSNIFSRFELSFEESRDFNYLSTDERLKNFKEHGDLEFLSIYMQYCRYLMISSSRKGGLPANLQGIWCKDFASAWDSKFTININTQMNYWPVFVANLTECNIPLIDFLKRLEKNGRKTAKDMYNCRGSVAHHNSDIYADTAPQDIVTGSTYWCFGLAWLSLHIFEQYLFTNDIAFLKENYYIMKQAALFFTDYLFEDENGVITSSPSTSPENVYIKDKKMFSVTQSSTFDFEVLSELFNACIKSAEILDCDNDFSSRLEEIKSKFPPFKIGSKGQLLEWQEEYEEIDPGHRHFSHLFSLFPGTLFDLYETPELCTATEKSLDIRIENGSAHTGWSRAWVINLYARLQNSKNAYYHLCKLFQLSTNDNLFNSHPPFQIDGNFGALAGFCEMLVQSHNRIILLPALPVEFKSFTVKGLLIRGGVSLDMVVKQGRLKKATLLSQFDKTFEFYYNGACYSVALIKNMPYEFLP